MSLVDYCRWKYLTMDVPAGASSSNIVCLYRFDERINGLLDRSGNGHNLTINGALPDYYCPTDGAQGVNAIELRLNWWGVGPTGLTPGTTGAYTIEFIWTPTAWTAADDYVFSVGGPTEAPANNVTVSVRIGSSTLGGKLGVLIEYSIGIDYTVYFQFCGVYHTTQHVAITRAADGVTYKLYLNAELVETVVAAQAPTEGMGADTRVYLGGGATGNDMYGYLSTLRYTRELYDDAQILESYLGCRLESCGVSDPPYLANQDPAPDATGVSADAPVYTEVLDPDGDLDGETVELYINDTLAWFGARPLPGFAGERVAVATGYGYTVTPAAQFEPGMQTVRGVATDLADNPMDESYSFSTRGLVITEQDIAEAEQETGIDLKLDTTGHDVVVEDYDLVLVAGIDEVAQHLLVALRLFLGEWYLDEHAGMAYYRDVFITAPSTRVIETLFRQTILSDDDIEHLKEFSMAVNRATRKLDVEFTAISSIGPVEVDAVFP